MERVNKAIEKLNSKEIKANINWNRNKTSGVISVQNDSKGKAFNGVLSMKDRNIEIDIAVSNYNLQYVKGILKDAFQQSGVAQVTILLKAPKEGDKVLVGNEMCNGLQPSQQNEIKLPAMTLYFAKNSHYVNCNGEYLSADFMARFNQRISGKCPDGDAQMFCEFLLLRRV